MVDFSYAKLRSLERQERQSPELTNVGNDFYQAVLQHIQELEQRMEEEHEKNAGSKRVLLISDELRNTKRTWESIFERREKKVVQAALSAARGGSHTPKHLTSHEKEFYRILVSALEENRRAILEGKQPSHSPPTALEKQEEPEETPADEDAIPETPPVVQQPAGGNMVLRILKNVPSFVGTDMQNYSLNEEDVIALPQDIAEILIKRGAAEKVTIIW